MREREKEMMNWPLNFTSLPSFLRAQILIFDIYSLHSIYIPYWGCYFMFQVLLLCFSALNLTKLFKCVITEIVIGDYCHPQVFCKFDV